MEPSENAEYGRQQYWEKRYTTEEHYDWFPSVYEACVTAAFDSIETVYQRQSAQQQKQEGDGSSNAHTIKVLHLGTGNSHLCEDIHCRYIEKYTNAEAAPYQLHQVAIDYSPIVIEKMKQRYTATASEACEDDNSKKVYLPNVDWAVADVRDLSPIRSAFGPHFDVVIDKGTMDALQANHDNPDVEDDIEKMLLEVSACLTSGATTDVQPCRQFVQMTWEIPYYRLHYTTKNESHVFAWGTTVQHSRLGDGDMYRLYIYDVGTC